MGRLRSIAGIVAAFALVVPIAVTIWLSLDLLMRGSPGGMSDVVGLTSYTALAILAWLGYRIPRLILATIYTVSGAGFAFAGLNDPNVYGERTGLIMLGLAYLACGLTLIVPSPIVSTLAAVRRRAASAAE